MTTDELRQSREALQASLDHFLTVTSDFIETLNNHMDKVYGCAHSETKVEGDNLMCVRCKDVLENIRSNRENLDELRD